MTDAINLDPLRGTLIVLVGATATGKTAAALCMADQAPMEIVNADSRQIYRGMDIGTAKPSLAERRRAPHHLFDITSPDQTLTLAEYQRRAKEVIGDIMARGRLPLLVGGTPLYVRAIVDNLRIPVVPPDPALRAELEAELAAAGVDALYARLRHLDPLTAQTTDPRNGRRIVRALEVFLKTGQPKAALEGTAAPDWPVHRLGLDCARPALHARIDARVDAMMERGLLGETQDLLQAGYDPDLPAMSALGYRQLLSHVAGELSLPEAVQRIKFATHRYVRHQATWFRRMTGVRWFQAETRTAAETARSMLLHLEAEGGD